MKRSIFTATLVAATALSANTVHAQQQDASLSLAGAQSSAYVLGGGLAEVINAQSDIVSLSAQTSQGFSANIRLVNAGDADFGLAAAPTFYEALRGVGEFNEKYGDIRAVTGVWPAFLHCVAYADSGIDSVADLEGKRISVGLPATSGAVVTQTLLEAAGLWDKIQPVYQNPSQSADGMRDGKLDVMCANSGGAFPAFVGLASGGQLKLIPWDQNVLEQAAESIPGRSVGVITAGTYSWQSEDAPSIGHWTFLFANKDVPAPMVADMLDIMLSEAGRATLLTYGEGWKDIPDGPLDDVLVSVGLPFHDGAVDYWAGKGMMLPEIANVADQ
ncbi:TAXI family TRAP transporter solute-binding subunit [Pelagibacterium sediminicola]|uniref:TAXI family TRAP transporter solute-binding subunit n=1 Tax=Pelagibacterium sediminicola TaxID=2248761 RepID=UPI0013009A6B|nr:TAXI family TRAP transporter solute-binding subunit [Pelagibacterium sediminicola]